MELHYNEVKKTFILWVIAADVAAIPVAIALQ